MKGEPPNEAKVSEFEKRMKGTLELIENVWLKDTPYLTGDKITIADLLGVCEVEQPSKFVVPTTVPACCIYVPYVKDHLFFILTMPVRSFQEVTLPKFILLVFLFHHLKIMSSIILT
jgi:Glutathione S-transferase, C-terminal domain.